MAEMTSFLTSWVDTALIIVIAVIAILVFFAIGYLVAKIINNIIRNFLERVGLERFIKEKKLSKALFGFTVTQIITVYVKLYIVLASLGFGLSLAEEMAKAYLGLSIPFITNNVIVPFLNYLVTIGQGIVVVVAALFVANYLANTIRSSNMVMSKAVAVIIQGLVAYIALILALPSFLPHIDATIFVKLLEYFIMALVLAFGLGTGLAFGLGLKEPISKAASKNQKIFDNLFGKLSKK